LDSLKKNLTYSTFFLSHKTTNNYVANKFIWKWK